MTSYSHNAKIVGGVEAVAYRWPAHVFIYLSMSVSFRINGIDYTKDIESYCGGTLINSYTVLGAAHCIQKSTKALINNIEYTISFKVDASKYSVYAGN